MKKTLFIIILISITALVVKNGNSVPKTLNQIADTQLIMCDEVEMIIRVEHSTTIHLLYSFNITYEDYSEIIDDEYG